MQIWEISNGGKHNVPMHRSLINLILFQMEKELQPYIVQVFNEMENKKKTKRNKFT